MPLMAQVVPLMALVASNMAQPSLTNCTWLIFGEKFGGIYLGGALLLSYFHLSALMLDRDTVLHNAPTPLPTVRGCHHSFLPHRPGGVQN